MKKLYGYQRGINFGGWFSQCDNSEERYDSFIKEADFKTVKDWGLDHVRIPVDYNLVQNSDGSFKENGFNRIQDCIDLCHRYGLNMILDLHKTIGYSFDVEEKEAGFFENKKYQEYFYSLWEEFARRFGDNDNLAFELLNEVSEEELKDIWNDIALKAIKRIRRYAPDIKILIGGYHNNSVLAVKDLLPPCDENIVYNFHCYNPLVFTHQGAYWIPQMDQSFRMKFDLPQKEYIRITKQILGDWREEGVEDSDQIIDESYFERLFKEAIDIAEERDVALYCGEYGVINLADPEDTLKWLRCIRNVFEKYGIGRAVWSYREMDFGIVDEHYDGVRKELVELL